VALDADGKNKSNGIFPWRGASYGDLSGSLSRHSSGHGRVSLEVHPPCRPAVIALQSTEEQDIAAAIDDDLNIDWALFDSVNKMSGYH
jgi:hypothetical protein